MQARADRALYTGYSASSCVFSPAASRDSQVMARESTRQGKRDSCGRVWGGREGRCAGQGGFCCISVACYPSGLSPGCRERAIAAADTACRRGKGGSGQWSALTMHTVGERSSTGVMRCQAQGGEEEVGGPGTSGYSAQANAGSRKQGRYTHKKGLRVPQLSYKQRELLGLPTTRGHGCAGAGSERGRNHFIQLINPRVKACNPLVSSCKAPCRASSIANLRALLAAQRTCEMLTRCRDGPSRYGAAVTFAAYTNT